MNRNLKASARRPVPKEFDPAPREGPYRTGLWLLDAGFWPVVVTPPDDLRSSSPGKAPVGKAWGRTRPTASGLRRRYRKMPGAGIGILLGPAGGVVDFEIDDQAEAKGFLGRLFPDGMPPSLGWRSSRGEHRLFRWDGVLDDLGTAPVVHLAGGAAELRVGAAGKQFQSVCPPSPTTDGWPREWNGVWSIAPLPQPLLDEVARESKRPAALATRVPAPGERPGRSDRYSEAAACREFRRVRSAPVGSRNETLNRAAFSLGQLVGVGTLDPGRRREPSTGSGAGKRPG